MAYNTNTAGNELKNTNMVPTLNRWLVMTALFLLICMGQFTYGQTPQTITNFAPATPTTFSVGKTIALTATGGGSGNAIVFTSATTSVCTVAGSTATVLSVGTCTLRADQAGNATFSAAPQVSRNVVVNKGSQTITDRKRHV